MPAPRVATSPGELLSSLSGTAHVDGGSLVIDDEAAFRDTGISDVVWSATFSEDDSTVEAARWLVWEASQLLGAPSASIHELYVARGRGEFSGFTVPALNLRTQVFDMAAAACRAARSLDSGTVIFESGEIVRAHGSPKSQRARRATGDTSSGVASACRRSTCSRSFLSGSATSAPRSVMV